MLTGRMGRWALACIAAIALLAALAPLTSQADDVDPFGFSEDDYSSWGIIDAPYPFEGYDSDGNWIGYGCFPVGNGQVFAHLGVDADFNTLRGITGPGYQTRDEEDKAVWWQEGEWPDMEVHAVEMGPVIGIPDSQLDSCQSQSIQQLRGAAVIKTTQRSNNWAFHTLTYAVPGECLAIQEYVLETQSLNHYYIAVTARTSVDGEQTNGLFIINGKRRMFIDGYGAWDDTQDEYVILEDEVVGVTVFNPQARTGEPTVFIELTPYKGKSGYRYRGAMLINMIPAGEDPPSAYFHQRAYRQRTMDFWQSWSAQNRQFDTGDQRLDDMLAQIPVIIETQRDHYSGGVSPLVSYHGYWVRDHNGPILTYLANGRFAEVMRMLRYHRAACLHYGHCWMQVPLDLDLSELPGWQPARKIDGSAGVSPGGAGGPARDPNDGGHSGPPHQYITSAGDISQIGTSPEDWESVTVEQAEVPSWIVLQHFWLWQAMHEAGRNEEADEFIREAWPFITHNLFSMPIDPAWGVKFHGDETYAGGALYSTYDREESGALGYPNGYIPTDFLSFDNTLIHREAAGAVLFMANSLGYEDDRERAEELLITVNQALAAYDQSNHWSPAVSPVTGQVWPAAFSNIALRPFWLGIDKLTTGPPAGGSGTINMLKGPVTMAEHYDWTRDQLWQTPYPATTPWSGYNTGHSLGYWLSAATAQSDHSQAIVTAQQLLDSASPDGAFCEVINAGGRPVNIYSRINRIRPWESGINYHALVNYLDKQTGWFVITFGDEDLAYHHVKKPPLQLMAYPFPFTEVLVLTTAVDYDERLSQHVELANIDPERIAVWDAGLPFTIADLYATVAGPDDTVELLRNFRGNPANDHIEMPDKLQPRIPMLLFDTGVRGDLDRRTFKDHGFWYGEDMAQLIADYEELGGAVIYSDDLSAASP